MLLNPYRFGGGSIPSVLLLHMNGSNGSTTFTDDYGKTITAVGNAQISTAQSKFGGASGLFDGTGDCVTAPSGTDFDFSGNYTLETFARFTSFTSIRGLIARRASSAVYAPFNLYVDSTGKPGFASSLTGSAWTVNILSASSLSTGTWYHIAATRNGNVYTLWVDGTSVATTTVAGSPMSSTSAVAIGAGASNADFSLDGYLDEVRITKGTARYTGSFTPPSSAFTE